VTPGGAWSPAHRQRQLDAIRAANEKRWNREGEKEGQAARTKARFAAMTEEERQAWIESIKVGRRKSA
jgi:FixJ family two-component response regulator